MASKHRVIVEAGSNQRTVLSINETNRGDVYVRLHCGVNYGDTSTDLQFSELRFSIHPSEKSRSNTIKRTALLSDGSRLNQHSYTSCIKNKSGFAHLFTYLASEMSTSAHDVSSTRRVNHILASYEPSQSTLAFSVFVGSADAVFIQNFGINTFCRIVAGGVQLVVVASAFSFISTAFGRILEEVDMPPNGFSANQAHNSLLGVRPGRSPDECIRFHYYRSHHLMERLLSLLISLSPPEEEARILSGLLEGISYASIEEFMIPRGKNFYYA